MFLKTCGLTISLKRTSGRERVCLVFFRTCEEHVKSTIVLKKNNLAERVWLIAAKMFLVNGLILVEMSSDF